MFNFNKIKSMTTEWKRLTYGKMFLWNFNRAWKAPLRLIGLIR